jgi:rubrerythrin
MRNVLRSLERKVSTVQDRTLDALSDRDQRSAGDNQIAARLGSELEELKNALRSLDNRAAAVKDDTVGALLDKLEERESRLVSRFGNELDSVKDDIEALEKRSAKAQREALSDIVERLTAARGNDAQTSLEVTAELEHLRHGLDALGQQSTSVQQQTVESLLERLGEREAAGSTAVIERLTAELSDVQATLARAVETGPAQAISSITTELVGLKDELRDLAEKSSVAQETTVAVLAARLEALEAGELQAVSSITSELGSLREDMQALAAHTASDQQAAVTQELAGVKESLEQRQDQAWCALGELQGELAHVKDALGALHQKAIEVDEATVDALVRRLAERESKDAEEMQNTFQSAVETAVTQIEKAVYRATAKPIEHAVEATDVLVNKIFDNEDGDTSTNLDRLKVDQRKTKIGITDTLGKLRRMRGGSNNQKKKKK